MAMDRGSWELRSELSGLATESIEMKDLAFYSLAGAMIKMPGLAGVILVAVAFVFMMVSRLSRSRRDAFFSINLAVGRLVDL